MHFTYKTVMRAALVSVLAVMTGTMAQAAPFTSINGLDYDLGQFAGAAVTTNVGDNRIFGSTFDNPNGIDMLTLGELAAGQFGGVDPGDRITLGFGDGDQDMLTLTYGAPVLIGAGDASLFVVFEQASANTPDPEGTSFEISINGGIFVNAGTSASATLTEDVVGAGGDPQNQIVFDLTHADFGFLIGDTISTVKIQNLGIAGVSTDDPDFLFAARAGRIPAPEPGTLALFGLGLLLLYGTARWRRPAGVRLSLS
ncbi:MAG: PEP-CTERM sorting domain-containing protein [Alphaproteobacteria bacterium]|nr:PEP-CTERM sorting domain-containing protein [Alphaproteobacteria bacterium]